ncbi:hypothetical protein B0H19DRAFT_1061128 [Mycena capillaripes]|nr:hypothetical protein B0H19DRAFT_1061128 [Mycena capillaripes]
MDYLKQYANSDGDSDDEENINDVATAGAEVDRRRRREESTEGEGRPEKRRRIRRTQTGAARFLDVEAAVGAASDEEEDEEERVGGGGFIDDSTGDLGHRGRPTSGVSQSQDGSAREAEELARLAEEYQRRAREERQLEVGRQEGRRGAIAREEGMSSLDGAFNKGHEGRPMPALEKHVWELQHMTWREFERRYEWGRLRAARGDAPAGQLAVVELAETVLVLLPRAPAGWRVSRWRLSSKFDMEKALIPEPAPSGEEIALWDGVDEALLGAAASTRPGLALGPGCRVVCGFIVEMTETKEHGRVARVRLSVGGEQIVQSDARLYDLLTMETNATTTMEWELEAGLLKRHLLSVPCRLCLFDHVRVVSHHSENVGGRVGAIETSGYDPRVSIVIGEGKEVEVAMSEVIREFELGDLVDVVDGRFKGERGIIVHMVRGGGLQIYAASSAAATQSMEAVNGLLFQDEEEATPRMDGVLHIVAKQVEFADTDKRPGGWSLASSVRLEYKAVSLCEYDRKRNARGMHTGRGRFIGTEVIIVGPHAMKGRWGMVVDERFVQPRDLPEVGKGKKRERQMADGELWLIVREDFSLKRWDVPLEQAVHRRTQLSLEKARHVTPWAGALGWMPDETDERGRTPPQTPSIDPLCSDPAWLPSPVAAHPQQPAALGNDEGRWLCIAGLRLKRVDVRVLMKIEGQVMGAHQAAAGQSGYIELEKDLTEDELNKPITVRVGESVYPSPSGEGGWLSSARTSLAAESVWDSEADVVWVRFERVAGTPGEEALFHVVSLCRSYNEDGVLSKATRFD